MGWAMPSGRLQKPPHTCMTIAFCNMLLRAINMDLAEASVQAINHRPKPSRLSYTSVPCQASSTVHGPYLTVTLTPNVDCRTILAHVHYYLRSNNGEFVHNVSRTQSRYRFTAQQSHEQHAFVLEYLLFSSSSKSISTTTKHMQSNSESSVIHYTLKTTR
jgi:hypothetical protein